MATLYEYLNPQQFDLKTIDLLINAFGGQCFYVPKNKAGGQWELLVNTLGEDRAGTVIRWAGGEHVAIPRSRDEKNEETVRNLKAAGMPVSEIAKVGFIRPYSKRQIYRICEVK